MQSQYSIPEKTIDSRQLCNKNIITYSHLNILKQYILQKIDYSIFKEHKELNVKFDKLFEKPLIQNFIMNIITHYDLKDIYIMLMHMKAKVINPISKTDDIKKQMFFNKIIDLFSQYVIFPIDDLKDEIGTLEFSHLKKLIVMKLQNSNFEPIRETYLLESLPIAISYDSYIDDIHTQFIANILLLAIEKNNLPFIEILLSLGYSVNIDEPHNPLSKAINLNQEDIVDLLITKGKAKIQMHHLELAIKINNGDIFNIITHCIEMSVLENYIESSIEHENYEKLNALLKSGIKPGVRFFKQALIKGNFPIIKLFLNQGVSVPLNYKELPIRIDVCNLIESYERQKQEQINKLFSDKDETLPSNYKELPIKIDTFNSPQSYEPQKPGQNKWREENEKAITTNNRCIIS
ncbi:MAG: hypothetical protein J0H68_02795 [Sphingobacteriia bacterium]|nr:hypothetical protein [Sphingobacteriia bacterium]